MTMSKLVRGAAALAPLFYAGAADAAVDSYRYLHVTIETPWIIFLVLAPMVLAPLALMGIMVWRYAERRKEDEDPENATGGAQE
jgi:hypothetical protein